MASPVNQAQMETRIQNRMLEYFETLPDAVFGMLHPRFVSCDYEARTLTVVISVQRFMRNNNGVMHGGMIAAALDGIGGLLCHCYTPEGRMSPSIDLSVSYLAPVPIGELLHVRVTAEHTGRTLLHLRGEAFLMRDGAEQIAASSMATYYITE